MHQFLEKRFRLLIAVPVLLLAALQVLSVRQESATFDEGVHLAAGYRYWKTGRYGLNVEHPPLQKLLCALPLLILNPPLPSDPKLLIDQSAFAKAFLYEGPYHADVLLFLGRLPTIAVSALLLLAVAWAARRHFGASVAVPVVWLCALDPNITAHGRYVTTDVTSALCFFLAVFLWVDYWLHPAPRRALCAALALGLALGAKFSMLLLLPLLPGLLLLHTLLYRPPAASVLRSYGVLVLGGVVSLLVVALLYAPESWRVLRGRPIDVKAEPVRGYLLPPHTYLTGVRTVIDHNNEGHTAYLLGEISNKGWWWYFPFTYLVKSTVALLLLTMLALAIGLWKFPLLLRAPRPSYLWSALAAAPLAYFAVTLTSHINIGVRHLLPVVPFVYLLAIGALAALLPARRYLAVAACFVALQAAESLAAFPGYLGFFNVPSGGTAVGSRYLLDSNLDWGQDLKRLKTYIDTQSPGTVCLEYFGSADPKYYGITAEYLPKTWDKDERGRMNCIGVISATLLHDVYIRPGSYEWLRQRQPAGLIGSSLFLYDLRQANPRP
ncbi:MAG TPA: glycosyltransferase family 39 protein [Bryobacteraceae bacterium]|nr:glycosyltransferase family 39 protein [Bryobacteraceae bacterium]